MPRRLYHLLLSGFFLMAAGASVYSANADAADRIIAFDDVKGPDIALVQEILATDSRLNDLVMRDYIRIPQDIRIAKADLDDSGKEEILLLIKHNGDKPCSEEPCQFQIWKQDTLWKRIGAYEMKEENLHMYDETYNGFHELANSQGIIPWYDF